MKLLFTALTAFLVLVAMNVAGVLVKSTGIIPTDNSRADAAILYFFMWVAATVILWVLDRYR